MMLRSLPPLLFIHHLVRKAFVLRPSWLPGIRSQTCFHWASHGFVYTSLRSIGRTARYVVLTSSMMGCSPDMMNFRHIASGTMSLRYFGSWSYFAWSYHVVRSSSKIFRTSYGSFS